MLKFSFGNSKLIELSEHLGLAKKQVVGFDLPAGYTCKCAKLCKSFSNRKTGKITDGQGMQFRCYAASTEAAFTAARNAHWHNFDELHGANFADMVKTIDASLPEGVKVVRIHASGDYFCKEYFQAWIKIAQIHPEIIFFGYTKILNYVNIARYLGLPNFKLQYSFGGTMDELVTDEPTTKVIPTVADAEGLPVACQINPADDFDYIMAGVSFAIALHGTQPKGSKKHG
jgi:hypothetical protein